MIRKYILFLPIILFFVSCADKERNLSSSDVIGCRMMELQGNTFFITAPIGALVQKTGNLFKDEEGDLSSLASESTLDCKASSAAEGDVGSKGYCGRKRPS